jgi:glycosyltransferase involved in cell wall biosynthesis
MPNVLMIHFSPYPVDVRIRREAETLFEKGMSVDTISIRSKNQMSQETHDGVTTYRINLNKKRSSKLRYIWEYIYFALMAFYKAGILNYKKKYDLVHVHNMPDFLVFCALIPKLSGAKILLDLHDPVPEIYMTKYRIPLNHPVIKLLVMIEKISIRFADHVITPNIAFRDLFIKRGCDPKKIDVVMNTPMEKIFLSRKNAVKNVISRKNGEFVVMYHGTITLRNGCIDIIDAINRIKNEIPNIKFHIFGNGDAVDLVKDKINELGLSKIITYYGLVKNEVISDAIREIDIGIIPNQMNPFTNHNFPVRIFEYLALKKPVIVPKTKGITDYFDQDSIIYFDPGNIADLADKILNCYRHPEKLQQKVERGNKIYQQFTWSKQRITLENIASTLIIS